MCEARMTNLKSVDDYSIPVRDVFVLCDCTNGGVNNMTFIDFTPVPNFYPVPECQTILSFTVAGDDEGGAGDN